MPEIITNPSNLSKCWMDAAKNDPYNNSGSDYSVTSINQPPQQKQLMERHDYAVDVRSKVWSILGTAVHEVLERMGGAEQGVITEQRLFMTIETADGRKFKFSGAVDRCEKLSDGTYHIKDFKITKVFAVSHGVKDDWQMQLNIYRMLAETNLKVSVNKLSIEAMLKDWSERDYMQSRYSDRDYPSAEIHIVDVPLLTREEVMEHIMERIELHESAKFLPDTELPECTDAERWCTNSGYRLNKLGVNRALPKCSKIATAADAEEIRQTRKDKDNVEVTFVRGVSKRCERFCPVKQFCNQYQTKINPKF